ncbi:MAG: nuclear transport factor 2 family protein [Acidobacteriaceae bacterium]
MNRKIIILSVSVCCLAVAITMTGQGGNASAQIQQLEKDMRAAEMKNDVGWYQKHLADGYVEGHSWGEWATKDEAIKQAQDKSIKMTKGDVSDLKVQTFGANTAVAHYKFTYDATFKGTHRARSVICSDTWINESGAWKLISNHCSHIEGT